MYHDNTSSYQIFPNTVPQEEALGLRIKFMAEELDIHPQLQLGDIKLGWYRYNKTVHC